MRRGMVGALLFASMLPGCVQDQPSPGAFQALDTRSAAAPPPQGEPVKPGCENVALNPSQGGEYDLVKNLMGANRGCEPPPPIAYQKTDQKIDGRAAPSQPGVPPSQQQELDRAACRAEGDKVANANLGLQPGEYDLVKNLVGASRGDADTVEKNCMIQRGYTPEEPVRKSLMKN
jgi:hypothetical protein